jgi:hypothetical protein
MNFLYPRVINIKRLNQNTAVGAQSYSGINKTNETVIATGIAAHIQADRQGTSPTAKLPGDAAGESTWKIIFKAALGLVQARDFIVDDLGNTYQVISPDWGPLVTTCRCQIMET